MNGRFEDINDKSVSLIWNLRYFYVKKHVNFNVNRPFKN